LADTTYIKKVVEPWVRDNWLQEEYGQTFQSKMMPLTGIHGTKPGQHEFDAVSKDGAIIAAIKGHSFKTAGGNLPPAKFASLYQELYFLSLVDAKGRLLIFTNQELYDDFVIRSRGKVADGIELVYCELPKAIQREVAKVSKKASDEMGR
jgi:hypothetical protein